MPAVLSCLVASLEGLMRLVEAGEAHVGQQSRTVISRSVRSVVPQSFEVLITRISKQVPLALSTSSNVAHVILWLAGMGCH